MNHDLYVKMNTSTDVSMNGQQTFGINETRRIFYGAMCISTNVSKI